MIAVQIHYECRQGEGHVQAKWVHDGNYVCLFCWSTTLWQQSEGKIAFGHCGGSPSRGPENSGLI